MVQTNKVNYDLEFTNLSKRDTTNFIVIHHTGGTAGDDFSAEEIHRIHCENGWAGVGYHYIIRRDGTIEIGRPEWAIGSHAYGFNAQSIGIHICGNFEFDEEYPTSEQIESVSMLIAELCAQYDLPIDREHVLGHYQLNATACPGKNVIAILDDIVGKANWYNENYEGTTLKKTDLIDKQEKGLPKNTTLEESSPEEVLLKETLPEVNEVINEVISPNQNISKQQEISSKNNSSTNTSVNLSKEETSIKNEQIQTTSINNPSTKNEQYKKSSNNVLGSILKLIESIVKLISNIFKK